jgi:hypothetical protein
VTGLSILSAHPETVFSLNLWHCERFYPRNINYMPVVKFLACLDLERKSSFLDEHYLSALSNGCRKGQNTMRIFIHYLFAVIALSIYGGQV